MSFVRQISILLLLGIVLMPALALAQDPAADQYGAKTAADAAGLKAQLAGETETPKIVGKIVAAGLSFLGIIFFGLTLYAGLLWMTARGNTEAVTKAKDMLEAAAIGLTLVIAAYAISTFVFKELTGG